MEFERQTIIIKSIRQIKNSIILNACEIYNFQGFFTKRKIIVNIRTPTGRNLIIEYYIPYKYYYKVFLKCLRDKTK